MEIMTRGKLTIVAVLALGGALVIMFGSGNSITSNNEGDARPRDPVLEVYPSHSKMMVRVGGMVTAADAAIIYAQTAGVVKAIPVAEGTVVQPGALLVKQDQPVTEARLGLAAAEGALANLQQGAATLESQGASKQAAVRSYTATELALLRSRSDDHRLSEAVGQLESTLDTQVVNIIQAIDFVNQNRTLFSLNDLRKYDEAVLELYGTIPNYFRRTLPLASTGEPADLVGQLATIKALPAGEATPQLQTYATLLQDQINSLLEVYTAAEEDIYKRSNQTTDVEKAEYEANRSALLGTAATLQEALPATQQVIDATLTAAATNEQAVATTEIDKAIAEELAAFAEQIKAQTAVVSKYGQAVVLAEYSLAQATAPFAGVVTEVFADVGEYVTPGTPLIRLTGSGARELEVTMPAAFAEALAVGQPFIVADQVVGHVTTFSPVSVAGSIPVTITIEDPDLSVGSSVVGHVELASVDGLVAVPRAYLHFDTVSPYLLFASGDQSPFTIAYDEGGMFYGWLKEPHDGALVASTGINF